MRLRGKLLFASVSLLLLPAIATLIVLYRSMSGTYRASAAERLEDSVVDTRQTMDEFIHTRGEDLRALSLSPMFWQATDAEISAYFTRRVAIFPHYRAFYHANNDGTIVASSDHRVIGQALLTLYPKLSESFRRAVQSSPDALFATQLTNESIEFLSGISDRTGKTDGVLVGQVDTRFLRDLMQELERRTPGEEHTYLASGTGVIALNHSGDYAPNSRPSALLAEPVVRALRGSGTGVLIYPSGEGKTLITAFSPLQGLGDDSSSALRLVSTADYAMIIAPLRSRFVLAAWVIGAVSALSMLVAVGFSRRLAQRLEHLAATANSLGAGQRESLADASMPDELGEVAAAFNQMAASVSDRSAALQRSNEALAAENLARQRTQEELRSALVQLEQILAHSPAVVYQIRVEGETFVPLSVSDNITRLLGFPKEETMSYAWLLERLHPDDRGPFSAALHELFTRGAGRIEYRLRHLDGSYRWIDDVRTLVRDAEGGPLEVIGVWIDITERKEADTTLRESEERFRDLFENSTELIQSLTSDGHFAYVNRSWHETLGYTDDELPGLTIFDVVHPRDLKHCHTYFQRVMEGEDLKVEFTLRARDGREIAVEGTAHCQLRNGIPSGTRAILLDITQRKQSEIALVEMHERLLVASREAGMAEIATSVLHNVGNVLNSVNVSADRIAEKVGRLKIPSLTRVEAMLSAHREDLPDFLAHHPQGRELPGYLAALVKQLADPQKEILPEVESLRSNVEHIREIVRMQQDYARIGEVLETVSIAALADDAIRISAASFARHHVEVVREYVPVPPFRIDKHKVLQILVNLLSNATHALDERRGTNGIITIHVAPNENGVVVSVTDNGVGIPADRLTQIFQHGFTTRKDGHGFGLHSGALAAQELGGSLAARSDGHGQGATFVLQLPLAQGVLTS